MNARLIDNSVKRTLFGMAFPMLAGTVAMNTYNLADTWFVSKLGTDPLAAMGFTFPVVMLLTFIAGGIGTGVTTLTSHAIGRGDSRNAGRTVTHGVLLIVSVASLLTIIGYLTMSEVFTRLGADSNTMPLVKGYMKTWYTGALFMAFPMMGNGILIALGDSRSASLFMASGAVLNCLLDPVMIFGWFGFPALGIKGAALATVLSQAFSSLWLFYLLTARHRLLHLYRPEFSLLLNTWKRILGFAVPGSISMILMPISSAVITALVSRHGNPAVAGVSAAGRIEMFAFIIPMALGMSLVPFVSQNYGAGRFDRIYESKVYSTRFAFYYGIFISAVFYITAPFLAGMFTDDPRVYEIFILYVRTVSFGYGMMEIHRYGGFFLTGLHRPVLATTLNAVRVLAFLVPLSFLGNYYFGITGIFAGRLITDWSAGIIAFIWISYLVGHKKKDKTVCI